MAISDGHRGIRAGAIDNTNIDSANPQYRVIAKLNANGTFSFTETNAYSGNNGRAAIL